VERRATLFRLVDRLPTEQQRVVVLRFVEQKRLRVGGRSVRLKAGEAVAVPGLEQSAARMEGADA